MSEIQRTRLVLAMAEVACERGAGDATVAHVVQHVRVSRRTFYEIFEGREDCFLAAFEEAVLRAREYVSDVCDQPQAKWTETVRSVLEALLGFLDREPVFGRLAVVESLGAGPRVLERRAEVLTELIAGVDAGRTEGDRDRTVTVLTAEGVVGGVISVIHARMLDGESGAFLDLANPLMGMIALPYLGPEAAREELDRPAGKAQVRDAAHGGNPLKDLDMRLTYRTVRVLSAVAANPASSNRIVADASGIGDQGQISKLLARLEKLGFIKNDGVGSLRGEPNSWMLTKRGEGVAGAVAAQAARS